MNMFSGEIDAFPAYERMYVSLYSMEDPSEDNDSYEVELSRDEKTLTSFLTRLRSMPEPGVPCENYAELARSIMQRHAGYFYTDQENIAQIIDRYRKDFTPEHEFPGGEETPDIMDFFISESITLKEDTTIDGECIPKGTCMIFHHKGNLNG